MTESVRNLLCKAQGKQPLNTLLKHSHTLLRWVRSRWQDSRPISHLHACPSDFVSYLRQRSSRKLPMVEGKSSFIFQMKWRLYTYFLQWRMTKYIKEIELLIPCWNAHVRTLKSSKRCTTTTPIYLFILKLID